MARQLISAIVTTDRAGAQLPSVAVDAGLQHSFANTGKELLLVVTTTTAVTPTFQIPKTVDGQAITPLPATAISTSKVAVLGPFPPEIYNQADGRVYIDFSVATGVTIGVIKMGA